MPGPENDPYAEARRELERRALSPRPASLIKGQRRVIELMRRRAGGSSPPATLYSRLQALERENDRLRRGAQPTVKPK
jgi:hypothetical protein